MPLNDGVDLLSRCLHLEGEGLWLMRGDMHIAHLGSSGILLKFIGFAGLVFVTKETGGYGVQELLQKAGDIINELARPSRGRHETSAP